MGEYREYKFPADGVGGIVVGGKNNGAFAGVPGEDFCDHFQFRRTGTGDVPLTVFQSLPIDGIIIVTSPQDLVSMIVEKAVTMAKLMNIPILGIVENYSYFECPDCGKKHAIYGESHVDAVAEKHGLKVLAKLPIDPKLAALCDRGMLELMENTYLDEAFREIAKATGNED